MLAIAIDSGGSCTRVSLSLDGSTSRRMHVLPSLNPSSIGQTNAVSSSGELLRSIVEGQLALGEEEVDTVKCFLASASISESTLPIWNDVVGRAISGLSIPCEVLLLNDVAPLLLGADPDYGKLALVLGTGSCMMGTQNFRRIVRVGGQEYVASDEGGATHIGRNGLIAAVRDQDGRGLPTAIRTRLELHFQTTIDGLARRAAETAYPKQLLASMAPHVTRAWVDGDSVAANIIEQALHEVAHMARTTMSQVGECREWVLRMTGGLLSGSEAYRSAIERLLLEIDASLKIEFVSDSVDIGQKVIANGMQVPSSLLSSLVTNRWSA